jgi:transposase-like protein
LEAKPYERTETRKGYANGYKPKTVNTRVGKVPFAIPQVREGNFYHQALEKGVRSERALVLAMAEM